MTFSVTGFARIPASQTSFRTFGKVHYVLIPVSVITLSRRDCDFLHTVFVVPPLGGIEAATKPQVPVKTGYYQRHDYVNETLGKKIQPLQLRLRPHGTGIRCRVEFRLAN